MQILAIVWHQNGAWAALGDAAKLDYLKTLDDYISQGRMAGVVVPGWSKIDQTLPKAPGSGFVGVFGFDSSEQVHGFEKVVAEANWYKYFDSTNISVDLEGATEAEPHKIYARLLDVPTD